MSDTPERIYISSTDLAKKYGDENIFDTQRMFDDDIEYIRADIAERKLEELSITLRDDNTATVDDLYDAIMLLKEKERQLAELRDAADDLHNAVFIFVSAAASRGSVSTKVLIDALNDYRDKVIGDTNE